ncbi:hypothetical protein SO694_00013146 [Aureococcus anophagefferens]|uniref:Serine/threonine-protein phosphatase 4 regulatory subunit 3-like central domain-containing protein n=1 Tax=Aureococcus anophagefferens TaxID=44056 RepID=A0ABR1G0X7_AURAN
MSDDTGGAPPDDAPAPAPAPAPPAPPEDEQSAPAYRVKVYRLNEDGQWDDCGTGSVTLAKGSAPTILVLSENSDRGARGALLASRLIPSQDAYTKQGENIITWDTRRGDGGSAIADKAANETACVALSFQEKHGCDDLYARLQAAAARLIAALSRPEPEPAAGDRGALRWRSRDDEPGPPGVDDDGDAARAVAVLLRRQAEAEAGQFGGGDGDDGAAANHAAAFLARTCSARRRAGQAPRRGPGAPGLARPAGALAASFDDAEDGDDVEVLVKLADVVKLVVLLNGAVGALLDDPLFEPVLGALEYAADLKKQHAALAVDDGAAPRERRSWVEPDEAAAGGRAPRPAPAPPRRRQAPRTPTPRSPRRRRRRRTTTTRPRTAARASSPAIQRRRRAPWRRGRRLRFRVGSPLPGALLGDERPRTAAEARRVPLRRLALRASQMREVVPMEDATLRMRGRPELPRAAVLKEAALRPGMDDAQLSSIHGLVFSNNNEILRRLYDHTDYLKRASRSAGSAPEAAAESLEADLLEDGDGGAEAAHRRDRGLALRFLREMNGGNDDANKKARRAQRRRAPGAARRLPAGRRGPAAGAGGAARRGPALFWVLRLLACDGDLATLMHASDAALPALARGALYDVRVVGGDGVEVPLEDAAPGRAPSRTGRARRACELLAYCVRAHAYRMKYFVLRNHVAARVVALVECGGATATSPWCSRRAGSSARGAKDDFYTRYLVKNGSLGPVFRLLGNAAAASPAPPPPEDDGDADERHRPSRAANRPRAPCPATRSLLEGLETRHAQNKDLLERAARGFGGAKDDAPLTAAQLERRARIATEDADEAYFDDDDDFDDDMDDASDDDEAPGAPPGPPPGFAPREAARRRPPGAAFARRARATRAVVKDRVEREKAADLDGFARAGNDDEPPADEPNGAAKKAKLGESDASRRNTCGEH